MDVRSYRPQLERNPSQQRHRARLPFNMLMSRLNFTRINGNAVSCRELYMVGPEALSSPAGILIVCSVRSLPKGSVSGASIKPMTSAVTCRILLIARYRKIIGQKYWYLKFLIVEPRLECFYNSVFCQWTL